MLDRGQAAAARTLFGNYEILDTIGQGGMGVVYRAVDLSLDRVIALKVLRADRYGYPSLVSRFQREAQAIAKLSHPNIVETYGSGLVDRVPYIAMELVEGRPLSQVIKDEGRLEWPRALRVAEQAAGALDCAHEQQIIHRDIKPPNILVTNDDHVFVTDFGLAKLLTAETQLTVAGTRLGTPQYMSPEQCQKNEATTASDLYSLGVVLFVMCSGRLPYPKQDKAQLIMTIVSGQPARLRDSVPDAPEEVERLIAYLLEKNPNDRPPSAAAVCDAIARVREGKPLDTSDGCVKRALADLHSETHADSIPVSSASTSRPLSENRLTSLFPILLARWAALPFVARAAVIVLTASLFGAVFGSTLAWLLRPGPGIVAVAPESSDFARWEEPPPVASFLDESPHVLDARLNLPGFAVESLRWAGRGCAAAVQLRGLAGSPRAGQDAICLIDPSEACARVALFPFERVGGLDPGSSIALTGAFEASSQDGGLGNRVLFHWEQPGPNKAGNAAVFSTVGPSGLPAPLFDIPVQGTHNAAQLTGHRILAADLHPDGTRLAVALSADGRSASCTLVESRRSSSRGQSSQATLAKATGPITTVCYSPDGSRIAYLVEHEDGTDQLWVVGVSRNPRYPAMIAQGSLLLVRQAFSPDGNRLLIGRKSPTSPGRLTLARAEDGRIEAALDGACAGAWHPSGRLIAGVVSMGNAPPQLYAVSPEDLAPLEQLTHTDRGVAPSCSVSADGGWAAAIPADPAHPIVSFVRLATANLR